MASGTNKSISCPPESCSTEDNGLNEAGDFECNICLDLAHDPIVTLCGHLFCWPCLYKWLHFHSHSQECPVCKALIQEQSLIPLYGRGKASADPRSKPIPGLEIPHRPTAQRPSTAPPPEANNFTFGPGLMGLFVPIATSRFGFSGILPSLLDFHVPAFQGRTHPVDGNETHGNPIHGNRQTQTSEGQYSSMLTLLFLLLGTIIILYLIM